MDNEKDNDSRIRDIVYKRRNDYDIVNDPEAIASCKREQSRDVIDNARLGSYDKFGNYIIIPEIKRELINMPKLIYNQYSANGAKIYELKSSLPIFNDIFLKLVISGDSADLMVCEQVNREAGGYLELFEEVVDSYGTGKDDRLPLSIIFRNYNIFDDPNDFGKELKDSHFENILTRKVYLSLLSKELKRVSTLDEKEAFKNMVSTLKQGGNYGDKVLNEFVGRLRERPAIFEISKAENYNKAMNEVLLSSLEVATTQEDKQNQETRALYLDVLSARDANIEQELSIANDHVSEEYVKHIVEKAKQDFTQEEPSQETTAAEEFYSALSAGSIRKRTLDAPVLKQSKEEVPLTKEERIKQILDQKSGKKTPAGKKLKAAKGKTAAKKLKPKAKTKAKAKSKAKKKAKPKVKSKKKVTKAKPKKKKAKAKVKSKKKVKKPKKKVGKKKSTKKKVKRKIAKKGLKKGKVKSKKKVKKPKKKQKAEALKQKKPAGGAKFKPAKPKKKAAAKAQMTLAQKLNLLHTNPPKDNKVSLTYKLKDDQKLLQKIELTTQVKPEISRREETIIAQKPMDTVAIKRTVKSSYVGKPNMPMENTNASPKIEKGKPVTGKKKSGVLTSIDGSLNQEAERQKNNPQTQTPPRTSPLPKFQTRVISPSGSEKQTGAPTPRPGSAVLGKEGSSPVITQTPREPAPQIKTQDGSRKEGPQIGVEPQSPDTIHQDPNQPKIKTAPSPEKQVEPQPRVETPPIKPDIHAADRDATRVIHDIQQLRRQDSTARTIVDQLKQEHDVQKEDEVDLTGVNDDQEESAPIPVEEEQPEVVVPPPITIGKEQGEDQLPDLNQDQTRFAPDPSLQVNPLDPNHTLDQSGQLPPGPEFTPN